MLLVFVRVKGFQSTKYAKLVFVAGCWGYISPECMRETISAIVIATIAVVTGITEFTVSI